jgi:hypothetical protein
MDRPALVIDIKDSDSGWGTHPDVVSLMAIETLKD